MHLYDEKEIEDSLEACRLAKLYYGALSENTKDSAAEVLKALFAKSDSYEHAVKKPSEYTVDTSAEVTAKPPAAGHKRLLRSVAVYGACILLAYCSASGITQHVAHLRWVEGESMEPVLQNGDSVIIQKLSYYAGNPKRYDVVVFPVKSGQADDKVKNDYYVKRVIGLPGETVQIKNGRVYIDNKVLVDDTHCRKAILDGGNAAAPITLHKDEYFVLGDNRNMSTDSRSSSVGLVQKKDIVGKVFLRVWPFSHFGVVTG